MKRIKKVSVQYNKFGFPNLKFKKDALVTYRCIGENDIEIVGNKKGLKLLAKALLGVAEYPKADGYHIHLDDLYQINNENKRFIITKSEKENLLS